MRAKIFGEAMIDYNTREQMGRAMEQWFVKEGVLMPDAHLGYSLPIGAVVVTDGVVVPAWVGYDKGCGVCAIKTNRTIEFIRENRDDIFKGIYEAIPTGFHHNKRPTRWVEGGTIPSTEWCNRMFNEKNGLKQMGTLGGGNHFIEIGYDEDSAVWIIIHSGSRNVGHTVATHYMKEACYMHTGKLKAREGPYGFDVTSKMGGDYLMDMNFCLAFALANRRKMLSRVNNVFRTFDKDSQLIANSLINKTHNHVEYSEELGGYVHRKGATQANVDEYGVIPGNMRDGSFITIGLGNRDSLFSSSHGAGRTMSRKKAKETGNLEIFQLQMEGIKAKVGNSTIDERPNAYKDVYDVMILQSELTSIVSHIQPLINVKA